MTDTPADDARRESTSGQCSVRITTGSRLHFGLLDTVDPFGGVGVMIDRPGTEVVVSPCDRFVCEDQAEPRLRAIVQRVAKHADRDDLPRCRISVIRRAAPHCGLGSGTQLALATAEGVCRFLGLEVSPRTLATQIAMRGQRSAVGIHGYFLGGLIFESADRSSDLNPLKHRIELPSDWCVAIFQPGRDVKSVSGEFEREQFASLEPADAATATELKGMVTGRILPAAQEGDFAAFARAVHQYNLASGKLFEAVQCGPYNGSSVTHLIHRLIDHGGQGVGQSSWGPGVFAWFDSASRAEAFAARLPADVALIAITRPRNQPRNAITIRGRSRDPGRES